MRTVTLPGTDVETTELGLGCADLFRLPTAGQRNQLLAAAYERGIRHFDVAPMYGLGLGERELGRFVRTRPDVVVTTKFGIAPSVVGRCLGAVQGPARRLMQTFPVLRNKARESGAGPSSGGVGGLLYEATGYNRRAAQHSLVASLRSLGTEHVDLFLLHDPLPGSVRSDEVREFCEEARRTGTIRAWGVAGEPQPSRTVLRGLGPAALLQTRGEVLADPEQVPVTVAFGLLSEGMRAIESFVAASVVQRARWLATTGVDPADRRALATTLLRDALRWGGQSVVLVGTTRAAHLDDAVAATDRAREPAARPLHELLTGDPRPDRLRSVK